MAGLLDGGLGGDDTIRDEYGETQADRRQPIWSALIQGGMSLLAGGQELTPAQRAQYISQAGQTYGGINKAQMAQRSAAAQQMLQKQQLKAGQSKLDSQERLALLAKSPEFQAAVAKLEPEERMLLQASLDAGDMAHAQQILSSATKERRAQAETERKERADAAKEARLGGAGPGNPYGKGEWAVNTYNLQHAHPGSYEYWKAHDYLSKDQKAPDGTIIPKSDLPAKGFPDPSGSHGNWVPANTPYVPGAPAPTPGTPAVPAPTVPGAPGAPPVVAPPPPPVVPAPAVPGAPVPVVPPPAGPTPGPAAGGPPPSPLRIGGGGPAQAGGPPVGPAVPVGPPPVAAPPPPVAAPPPPVPTREDLAAKDPVAFGWSLPKGSDYTRADGTYIQRDSQGGLYVDPPDAPGKYYPKAGVTPNTYAIKPMPEKQGGVLAGSDYGLESVETLKREFANNNVVIGTGGRLIKGVGNLVGAGDAALDASNPEGRRARALIASLSAGKIKEMSGSAVSAAEFDRLDHFLPKVGDNKEQILSKLIDLERELRNLGRSSLTQLERGVKIDPKYRTRFGSKAEDSDAERARKIAEAKAEIERRAREGK